jgi:hypothetical protein
MLMQPMLLVRQIIRDVVRMYFDPIREFAKASR